MTVPSDTELRYALQAALGDRLQLEDAMPGAGMSSVYRARDLSLNRMVVVKVLPAELAAAVSIERFRREILVSAALQHPHIVPVLSSGEVGGLPYFVMPFIAGESLRARLSRGPLAIREAVAILKDVARALSYAHTHQVVHRDIKPDNILLTGGAGVVTDFGVAKALTAAQTRRRRGAGIEEPRASQTAPGIAIGTPAYMAPEQAVGDPNTDHRADLYALGVVAWEMLVGTAPFHGLSAQQVMALQVMRTPPAVGTRRYDVPKDLAAVIDHLLQKEPRDRPRFAADVVRALEEPGVLGSEVGSNAPAGPRRVRRLAGALAAALVALALLQLLS